MLTGKLFQGFLAAGAGVRIDSDKVRIFSNAKAFIRVLEALLAHLLYLVGVIRREQGYFFMSMLV